VITAVHLSAAVANNLLSMAVAFVVNGLAIILVAGLAGENLDYLIYLI
jgi:hypothetical protein